MGCGASKGVVVPILASDKNKHSEVGKHGACCAAVPRAMQARRTSRGPRYIPAPRCAVLTRLLARTDTSEQEESEKLEAERRMERVREWVRSADPAPWQEIKEAAQRLGMRPAGAPSGHGQSGRSLRRERTPERHSGRANQRVAQGRERGQSEPPALESPNASTHVSGGDIQRETPVEPYRRPMSASYQRPPISSESLSQGRPALSTEGWDVGEPSVGASEERDRFGGLGKKPLESGSLRKALKRLHEKIMGKPSIQHAFYDFDINHDNKISLDEFFEACSTLKTDLPKDQLSEVSLNPEASSAD